MESLETAAALLAQAFQPTLLRLAGTDAVVGELLAELGWKFPSLPASLSALRSPSDDLLTSVAGFEDVLRRHSQEEASDDDLATAAGTLVLAVATFASAVHDLPQALRAELAPEVIAATGIDEGFRRRLLDAALVQLLQARSRAAFQIGVLLGLVEALPRDEDLAKFQPGFVEMRVFWERLPLYLRDPGSIAREVYGWGTPDLDAETLAEALRQLSILFLLPGTLSFAPLALARLVAPGAPETGGRQRGISLPLSDDALVAFTLGVHAAPKETPDELQGLLVTLTGSVNAENRSEIGPGITLDLGAELDLASGLAVAFYPDRDPKLVVDMAADVPSAVEAGRAHGEIALDPGEGADRKTLVSAAGIRLEARGIAGRIGLEKTAGASIDAFVEVALRAARLDYEDLAKDSFLAAILPKKGAVDFELGVGWSTVRGFYWRGGGGLELDVPVHASIGPVTFDRIHLAFGADDGALRLEASATLSAQIGPVGITVDRIGLKGRLTTDGGNLGPVDLSLSFRMPSGLGVSVDAGPVAGGGFLSYDDATGRYAGALELQVFKYAVKAVGLLDTRVPGGSPAYSFVVLVTAEFNPIPLGWGFTLDGVGGIAGIHRRLDVDALRSRFVDGGIEHLLFAENPVRDAVAIVSDLAAVFPPLADHYVFGPMAKIGWAYLVTGELGLALELPSPARTMLFGRFHTALPRADAAIVELNLDVFGELDLPRGRLALDGRLRHSRVGSFAIEGELAFRFQLALPPRFLLSIGGFHPDFVAPAGFPELQRITVPIGMDDNPRLTLEGYLAVSSNTFQVGASASLYVSKAGFSLTGDVAFNALFTFLPFHFVADFSGKVALNRGSTQLAAIRLEALISGTTPWRAHGEACLEIRFLPDICVGFDASFGLDVQELLDAIDPWPALKASIEDVVSWVSGGTTGLPSGITLVGAGSTGAFLDPASALSVRQSVVPLARRITRVGEAAVVNGEARFDVTEVTIGADSVGHDPVQELFAPAHYEEMSDDEKLARPSFESMDAGLGVAGDGLALGAAVGTPVEYETQILDSAFENVRLPGVHVATGFFQVAALDRAAAGRAPRRNSGPAKFAPLRPTAPLLGARPDLFGIVSAVDLAPRDDLAAPGEKGAVHATLESYLALHPEDRGRVQVARLAEAELPA